MTKPHPTLRLRGARWWLRDGADAEDVSRWIGIALDAVASGASPDTKTGRRKSHHRIHASGREEPDVLLKANRYPARSALTRAFRPSKSRHELILAQALASRGLPTPVPLAAGEERRTGRLVRCWLLVPFVPGARDLLALAREDDLPARERRALARALGRLARDAHDAGLFQDDFAPNNVLVGPAPERRLWWIDFERARLRRGPVSDAERRWMLAKLERALPDTRDTDRMRFLLGYARGARDEAHRWWRLVAEEAERLGRRDLRRALRTATREGRRFRPVTCGTWRGFARRETTAPELQELVAFAKAEPSGGAARIVPLGPAACALERRGLSARAARAWWSAAVALSLRGLAPPASALLHHGDVGRLRVERPFTDRAAWRAPAARWALRRLLLRLLAIGALAPDATLAAFTLEAGPRGLRAWILDPGAFAAARSSARSEPGLGARARRELERLLGDAG